MTDQQATATFNKYQAGLEELGTIVLNCREEGDLAVLAGYARKVQELTKSAEMMDEISCTVYRAELFEQCGEWIESGNWAMAAKCFVSLAG